MLVLARKNREAVLIGGSPGFERTLKVTVLEIRGGCVKLGFEADRDLPVRRWEVREQVAGAKPAPRVERVLTAGAQCLLATEPFVEFQTN